jgi:hypothetical protein
MDSVLQRGPEAGRQVAHSPEFLAGERDVFVSVGFAPQPRSNHVREPIVRRQFVDAAAIVFLIQHKTRLLEIMLHGFPREKIEVPWKVLAKERAGCHAGEIGDQKDE